MLTNCMYTMEQTSIGAISIIDSYKIDDAIFLQSRPVIIKDEPFRCYAPDRLDLCRLRPSQEL